MRIAKNCDCLGALNMRMSIETAARTPMLNRKVHAESDFGLGLNLGITKWVFSYSNSEFAYEYRGCVRRPKQKRSVNAEFGLAIYQLQFFKVTNKQRRMNVSGARTNLTEPNQALQRINVLVADHAPSSMLRAKRVHR